MSCIQLGRELQSAVGEDLTWPYLTSPNLTQEFATLWWAFSPGLRSVGYRVWQGFILRCQLILSSLMDKGLQSWIGLNYGNWVSFPVRVFVASVKCGRSDVHLEAQEGKCFLVSRKEVKTLYVCIICLPRCSFSPVVEMIGRELSKMNVSKQFVFLLHVCQWKWVLRVVLKIILEGGKSGQKTENSIGRYHLSHICWLNLIARCSHPINACFYGKQSTDPQEHK